jgi:hypothetical protein
VAKSDKHPLVHAGIPQHHTRLWTPLTFKRG